jgi:hypothetical protein
MAIVYKLPMDIAAAVATNRSVLCMLYANRTEDEEKKNMALLIGDLLEDRCALQQQCYQLMEKIKSMIGTTESVKRHAETMLRAARGSDDDRIPKRDVEEAEGEGRIPQTPSLLVRDRSHDGRGGGEDPS